AGRRLRDLAPAPAGRHRGLRSTGDAQLVHAGRRDGSTRSQAGRVRVRRDVVLQLQQVLCGVPPMTTPTTMTTSTSVNGTIPKLSGEIRPLIPKPGLRNSWYPAIEDRKGGSRKPVKVALLGEEICQFRGATGAVGAIHDVRRPRGGRRSAE